MKNNPLVEQSIDFSVEIINYYKWLVQEKKEFVLSRQILRSGTSIGANIHEANYAVSRADFISKMQISLKESGETEYWLIILEKTDYLPTQFEPLKSQCKALTAMLVSSLNTAKTKTDGEAIP